MGLKLLGSYIPQPDIYGNRFFPEQIHKDIFINTSEYYQTEIFNSSIKSCDPPMFNQKYMFETYRSGGNNGYSIFELRINDSVDTFNNGQHMVIVTMWFNIPSSAELTGPIFASQYVRGQKTGASYGYNTWKPSNIPANTWSFFYGEILPYYNIDSNKWEQIYNTTIIKNKGANTCSLTHGNSGPNTQGYLSFGHAGAVPADDHLEYITKDVQICSEANAIIKILNMNVYQNTDEIQWDSNKSHFQSGAKFIDLFGSGSLYLPGELIENQSQPTRFTKTGNLLIQNDFIEGSSTIAYKDHFEAFELIEY